MTIQDAGLVLVVVGLSALFGAWVLIAAGVAFVVVPELIERFL